MIRIFRGRPLPGREADLRRRMAENATLARSLPGCLSADVYQGDEELLVISRWNSLEALEAQADTIRAVNRDLPGLLAGSPVIEQLPTAPGS